MYLFAIRIASGGISYERQTRIDAGQCFSTLSGVTMESVRKIDNFREMIFESCENNIVICYVLFCNYKLLNILEYFLWKNFGRTIC